MGYNGSSATRKVHTTKYLHKEVGEFHTSNLKVCLKPLEQETNKQTNKKEANTPKKTRQWEIIKLRAKINKLETKITIQRINETKSRL